MHLPLSKRLQVCCDFVRPSDRVADIGCDHGFLGIYLLREKIASYVIAADINEMPLQSAMRNAEKYGVRDQIAFYLSDGVRNVPRNFDTLVCAGMGADTMISILDNAHWLRDSQYRLILQCQSKTPMLRRYLSENGWQIAAETVLRDGRFLYTVMEVLWQPDHPPLTVGQWYFSPALLKNHTLELREYYQQLLLRLRRAAAHRSDDQITNALAELEALSDDPNLYWLKE